MQLETVKSSNVLAIGYEATTAVLTVQFKGGATFDYYEVPAEKWAELQQVRAADGSVGGWVSSQIVRNHKFRRHEEQRNV